MRSPRSAASRRAARTAVTALATGASLAVAAAPAHAASVIGSATDRAGDSRNAAFDITGASSTYDPAGSWSIRVDFAAPLPATGAGPMLSATIVDDPSGGCSPEATTFASLSGGVGGGDSIVLFGPPADDWGSYDGTREISADRRSITFSAEDARLDRYAAPCVTARLVTSGMQPSDELDSPLTFPEVVQPVTDEVGKPDPTETDTTTTPSPEPGSISTPTTTTPDEAPLDPDDVPDPADDTDVPDDPPLDPEPSEPTPPEPSQTTPVQTTPMVATPTTSTPPTSSSPAPAPVPTSSSPAPAPVPTSSSPAPTPTPTSMSPVPSPVATVPAAPAPASVPVTTPGPMPSTPTTTAVVTSVTGDSMTAPEAEADDLVAVLPDLDPPATTDAPARATALTLTPTVAPTKLRVVLSRGLALAPGCSATCRLTVRVGIAGSVAKKVGLARTTKGTFVLVQSRVSGVSPRAQLSVEMPSAARKALAGQRLLRFIVSITAADDASKVTSLREVVVKR